MKRYLICFRNRKGEILSQKIYAKNQSQALKKSKLDFYEILAITKLEKKLGDKLL